LAGTGDEPPMTLPAEAEAAVIVSKAAGPWRRPIGARSTGRRPYPEICGITSSANICI
jgi:hypothetical protein